jgi:hypothetical protein
MELQEVLVWKLYHFCIRDIPGLIAHRIMTDMMHVPWPNADRTCKGKHRLVVHNYSLISLRSSLIRRAILKK